MFALLSLAGLVPAADPFTLTDGDRVVWIGSTVAEREQRYGYWETALHAAFPDAAFTFRNLGWSGDTVFGDSRAGFDTPKEGFQRLVGLTLELKPTIIFVSYGTNESFEGEAGLDKFEKGLERLLDALKPANARIVLFSPTAIEEGYGRSDAPERNNMIRRYAAVVEAVARRRGHLYADIFGITNPEKFPAPVGAPGEPPPPAPVANDSGPLTENGIHLTEYGYRVTAIYPPRWLRPGWRKPDRSWSDLGPLRKAIIAKNELFFHRWRPQNETYLFGFRKHEQGKNAREVAEFDPLVDRAEKEVGRIKQELLTK